MRNDLEYWTDFSFKLMRKEGKIMPNIIPSVLQMDDFINSSVTEEQLRESIKARFVAERQALHEGIKEKLARLRK